MVGKSGANSNVDCLYATWADDRTAGENPGATQTTVSREKTTLRTARVTRNKMPATPLALSHLTPLSEF